LHEIEIVEQSDPHDAGHDVDPAVNSGKHFHRLSPYDGFGYEVQDDGQHETCYHRAPERIERIFH